MNKEKYNKPQIIASYKEDELLGTNDNNALIAQAADAAYSYSYRVPINNPIEK